MDFANSILESFHDSRFLDKLFLDSRLELAFLESRPRVSTIFDNPGTQLALPVEMGGLGVSSASLLALSAFLASAVGASDILTTIVSQTFEDVSFTKALEKWSSLTNEQESPLNGTQKNCTQPVFVKTAQDLISRMDDKRSKVFNAHQGKFGSQWLNVVPCKNLGLKLDDQQLRI